VGNQALGALRQRAQEVLGKPKSQAAKVLDENAIAQRAEAAKTARLRELRLAKEAADRKAAEQRPSGRRQRPGKPLPAEDSRRENDLPGKMETPE
jgi:hypothetical protein